MIGVLWVPLAHAGPTLEEGYRKHDYKTVARLCKKLLQEKESLSFSHQMVCAESFAGTGEIEQAILLLKGLLKENPAGLDRVKVQYDLANLLFMQGHYQESKKMFEQVLSASLDRDEWIKKARQKIVQIRQKRGRSREQIALRLIEAEEKVEAGTDLYATKGVLLEILARTEGKQAEQAEKAKELLERLDDKERSLVTRELSNVQLLREEKKLTDARELLQKLLVDYPDMEERGHVESLLQDLEREEEVARNTEDKKSRRRVSMPSKSSGTKLE